MGDAGAVKDCRPNARETSDGTSSTCALYAFVRKEAVVSSQIEGTQATLVDLFEYEAEKDDRQPLEDVREVCNYLDALKYARGQLKSPKSTSSWSTTRPRA